MKISTRESPSPFEHNTEVLTVETRKEIRIYKINIIIIISFSTVWLLINRRKKNILINYHLVIIYSHYCSDQTVARFFGEKKNYFESNWIPFQIVHKVKFLL